MVPNSVSKIPCSTELECKLSIIISNIDLYFFIIDSFRPEENVRRSTITLTVIKYFTAAGTIVRLYVFVTMVMCAGERQSWWTGREIATATNRESK